MFPYRPRQGESILHHVVNVRTKCIYFIQAKVLVNVYTEHKKSGNVNSVQVSKPNF